MADRLEFRPQLCSYLIIAVCLSAIAGGVALIYKSVIVPSEPYDFLVYYYAAEQAIAGRPFVGSAAVSGMPVDIPYNYFPISILFFYPYIIFPPSSAFLFHIVVQFLATIGLIWTITWIARSRGGTLSTGDTFLIGAFLAFSTVSVMNYHVGQINHLLLLSIMLGYGLVTTDGSAKLAGVCFALPALFKLWPAVLGLWLLKQRAYSAVITSLGVGISGVISSILIFGVDTNLNYFHWLINVRTRSDAYIGGLPPNSQLLSIRRAVSAVIPNSSPTIMALVGIVLIGLPVMFVLLTPEFEPLDSLTAVLVGFLLTFPSIQHYMIYPLPIILLYAYTKNKRPPWYWLAVCMILVPLIILPRNIVRVVSLVNSDLGKLTNSALTPMFAVIHPPTAGMLLLLSVVVYRSVQWDGERFSNNGASNE
jgi:hypothetical protein